MRNSLKFLLSLVLAIAFINPAIAQLPGYVPTSGLIAYYGFNNNSNDLSGHGNNGIVSGPTYTADRFGNSNAAVHYTGTAERITTHTIDRTTINSFTYSVWVNTTFSASIPAEGSSSGLTSSSPYSCIIPAVDGANWGTGSIHVGAGLNVAANGVYVAEHGNSITNVALAWTGTLTGWHHIVLTYVSKMPKLYIDGYLVHNGITSSYIVHPSLACDSFTASGVQPYVTAGFGHGLYPITVPSYNYSGDLDDLAIYSRALSSCEISELYDTVLTIGAISGLTTIMSCSSTTLTCPSTGGTWATSTPSVAVVGSSTGIVTGGISGYSTISYTTLSGCVSVVTVNVIPLPSITGPSTVCQGLSITLSNSLSGGRWYSGSANAQIDSITGVLTGMLPGTSPITYLLPSGCSVALMVTVNPVPAVPDGPDHICAGSSALLTDSITGGSWTSSGSAATIGISSGIISGIALGSATITYSLPTGCKAYLPVTIIPAASPITGVSSVCIGSTTTLSGGTLLGGVWSSSNIAKATVGSGTGIVTGISAGTLTISYVLTAGCLVTKIITVNALPSTISGASSVCIGQTFLLFGIGGGTWSSTTPSVASVGTSGIVTGIAAGVDSIIYSLPVTGCMATKLVTVNPIPAPITGISYSCPGMTTTLSDFTGGGAWSSSSTSVATIGGGTGIITVSLSGATLISYTLPTGCAVTLNFTVNPLPAPISGPVMVCTGQSVTLADGGGGTWISSSPSLATIGSSSGVVSGIAFGVLTVTYTLSTGCSATLPLTVNTMPAPVTGGPVVCVGLNTTLSDVTTGGSWSSSNAAIAGVGAGTGIVSGVSSGVATISYVLSGGCMSSSIVTVNPQPGAITVSGTLCTGQSATLTDGGGGLWTSSSGAIVSIGSSSGFATAILPGTSIITYTLPTGCSITTIITVNPLPLPIVGPFTHVCQGSTLALTDATTAGSWTSNNYAIAYVDIATGLVTGLTVGAATITYSMGTGCIAVFNVTVNTSPDGITGIGSVCSGSSVALTDASAGGIWSGTPSIIATVGSSSGLVTGVLAGLVTITYTLPSGCFATMPVIVNASPLPIAGVGVMCVGLTSTLTDPTPSGIWTSSNSAIANVFAISGIVTGMSMGTAVISYASGTGCVATFPVTINGTPGPVLGVTNVCIASTTTLSNIIPGGIWSVSLPGIASVGPATGIVTGIAAGFVVVSYSLGVGCATFATVTVFPPPGPIGGVASLCTGGSTTLTDAGAGTWSSGSSLVATVGSASGFVTGVSAGVSIITYRLSTGCTRSIAVSVNPLPALYTVTGGGGYCAGGSGVYVGLSGSSAGVSYQLYNATVPIGLMVIGTGGPISFGLVSATGIYTVIATTALTACARPMSGSVTVSINSLPVLFTLTGGGSYCADGVGMLVGLNGSSVGVNYKLYIGSAPGTVMPGTGLPLNFGLQTVAGSYTIVATNATSLCSRNMTGSAIIVVNPVPLPIGGPSTLCVGATIPLTEVSVGGVWSSSAPLIASIGSLSGIVNGVAMGVATIDYTFFTGCTTSKIITVSGLPLPVTGPSDICAGATGSMADLIAGGLWTSGNPTIASIGSLSGTVTGNTVGAVNITYSLGTGCTSVKSVTVNAAPAAISGLGGICIGASAPFSDVTPGGAWVSSAIAIATVIGPGIVTGVAAGTVTIDYTVAGCMASRTITVNATPSAIAGPSAVCAGAAITETNSITGGTWNTVYPAISIGSGTGIVTGVSSGLAVITYSIGSCATTRSLTVNVLPAITGPTGLCTGATGTLSPSVTGGGWLSVLPGVVSVGATTGVLTALTPGMSAIIYTLPSTCQASVVVTVSGAPSPIIGTTHVCVGTTTPLTDLAGGGIWTLSPAVFAAIGSSSGIVSGAIPGIVTITYSLGSGCTTSTLFTINANPAAILGLTHVCVGSTDAFSDATPGGTWSSGSLSTAIIGASSGIATGVVSGVTVIRYSSPVTGCFSTASLTVNPLPAAITGASTLCSTLTTTYADATASGIWASSLSTIAAVSSTSGIVTGMLAGVATISYTLPTGCAVSKVITINSSPAPITGSSALCVSASVALSDVTPAGSWSSSLPGIATVSGSGVVMGLVAGVTVINYIVSGCATAMSVTVNNLPPPTVGAATVCLNTVITRSDPSVGGLWSSGNTLIATVGSATGMVTGISVGTAAITYSMGVGCAVSAPVSVLPLPLGITGIAHMCLGSTTLLSDVTPGGVWGSGLTSIATVSGAGLVTGIAGGLATISYTAPSGCSALLTVNVITVPAIAGVHNLCAWGDTMSLSDINTTGIYTSSLATATNLGGGLSRITANAPGSASVSYLLPSGCITTATFMVNPLPGAIAGSGHICSGSTLFMSDPTPGGAWSSGNALIAVVGSGTGLVTGISGGTVRITYSLVATGCRADTTVLVYSSPAPIAGPAGIFIGSPVFLTEATPGGTWSSSNVLRATVGGTGLVTGVSIGSLTISYTAGGGLCQATKSITVMPPVSGHKYNPDTTAADPSIIHEVTINPNPNNGLFTLNLLWDKEEQLNAIITDVAGRKIKEFIAATKDGLVAIPLELSVAPGIYLLSLTGADSWYAVKIVVVSH
jgi:uncharacterized protein YjdB